MDIHIQPNDKLQHLTNAGRFQTIERIRESKIHFSYFWTADGSLHIEVDGLGFKTFPAVATIATIDEYIQWVKEAQAQISTEVEVAVDKVFVSAPKVNLDMADEIIKLAKQRDEALADRDLWAKLCGATDCYTPSSALPYGELKRERDKLRAEVKRLNQLDRQSIKDWTDIRTELNQLKLEIDRMRAKEKHQQEIKKENALKNVQ
jgi:hypothetical protein